jgi:hypothetical protein
MSQNSSGISSFVATYTQELWNYQSHII